MHDLSRQIKDIGLNADDIVMVHASMRAAQVDADALIAALLKNNRTMMMYIGCGSPYDDIGRDIFSPEAEKRLLRKCPAFDPHRSPADPSYGKLGEIFRQYSSTVCSFHAGWRMAANGAKAHFLLDDHPLDYGGGDNSPLARLVEISGKVLLIGSDLDHVTILHYAEEIAHIPNKRKVRVKTPFLIDGKRQWTDITELDSSKGIVEWPDRFFAQIIWDFIDKEEIVTTKIGNANSYLLDAEKLIAFAVPYMERTAKELKPS